MQGIGGKVAINYEDLGLAEPGAGWRMVKDGIRMIANIHDQLLGRAGTMHVKAADVGLAHNLGGPGAVSAVAVVGQP